jgi:hypothetical protein
MELPMIPWAIFLDALRHQQASTLELWLRRWWFTNEGVIMKSSAWQEITGRLDNDAAHHEAVQA